MHNIRVVRGCERRAASAVTGGVSLCTEQRTMCSNTRTATCKIFGTACTKEPTILRMFRLRSMNIIGHRHLTNLPKPSESEVRIQSLKLSVTMARRAASLSRSLSYRGKVGTASWMIQSMVNKAMHTTLMRIQLGLCERARE